MEIDPSSAQPGWAGLTMPLNLGKVKYAQVCM